MISFLSINTASATAAKLLQSCPTLWDPIDSSPPGSPVPGILQARTLEWVAISFSIINTKDRHLTLCMEMLLDNNKYKAFTKLTFFFLEKCVKLCAVLRNLVLQKQNIVESNSPI